MGKTLSRVVSKYLTLLTLFMIMAATFANAAPRLTLPETVFNFGYAPQNAKISHRFWLISTGDDTLKILNIIPGCSCTRAPLDKSILASGDSTVVEIIFSTKTYRDRVNKSPKIQTNEGTPDKALKIIATVVTRPDSTFPIVIQPYKLDLSQKTKKRIDKIEFSIRNVSEQELKLNIVSIADDYFEVILPKSVKPGEVETARLQLRKSALDQAFEKSFTIKLSDDNGTRFTIPVKRTLAGNLETASTTTQ